MDVSCRHHSGGFVHGAAQVHYGVPFTQQANHWASPITYLVLQVQLSGGGWFGGRQLSSPGGAVEQGCCLLLMRREPSESSS
jgi:hypothetical protein